MPVWVTERIHGILWAVKLLCKDMFRCLHRLLLISMDLLLAAGLLWTIP